MEPCGICSAPPSMGRILAIGDVHGCITALDALLAAIGPGSEDTLVFLGDYVDRGPDSRGVIDRVLDLMRRYKVVPLRGNHEAMMVESRADERMLRRWQRSGGIEALASYSTNGREPGLGLVPHEHWRFLTESLFDFYETGDHIFVHAGLYPHLPLEDQPTYILLWEKVYDPLQHMSGKIVVCGHTRQKDGRPRNWGHTVCIDTNCARGGWLTGLDVTTGRMWQSNEAGEVITAWIDDYDGKPGLF
jgi:serine/threonine protein phosphatase 1